MDAFITVFAHLAAGAILFYLFVLLPVGLILGIIEKVLRKIWGLSDYQRII